MNKKASIALPPSIKRGARASTERTHQPSQPAQKEKKKIWKENTPISKANSASPSRLSGLSTNRSAESAERQLAVASASEGGRSRAFTTKSLTTGLVSGCVPSATHHVPHASTSTHLRLRSQHQLFLYLHLILRGASNRAYLRLIKLWPVIKNFKSF